MSSTQAAATGRAGGAGSSCTRLLRLLLQRLHAIQQLSHARGARPRRGKRLGALGFACSGGGWDGGAQGEPQGTVRRAGCGCLLLSQVRACRPSAPFWAASSATSITRT